MSKKLYLGNVPWRETDESLEQFLRAQNLAFARAEVVVDRESGRSRGFAFVHFDTEGDGQAALKALNGADLGGRSLRVDLATERQASRGEGGGGGRPRRHRASSRRDHGRGSDRDGESWGE